MIPSRPEITWAWPIIPALERLVVAADDVLATNLAQAALEGIYLKFSYNQTTFEEGPLVPVPVSLRY
jgi:hypothetical protein